ncbi:MAG: hypothetical protein PHS54_00585 [Clostridia bacterium]|nr:hypothetical protein [Clostridia bacterium]
MSSVPITQTHLNKSRKDKFQLILTIPNILKSINTKRTRESDFLNLDSLQFSVYSVNIPNIEVPAHQLHFGGQTHNITSFDRPAYPPSSVGFVIDNEFKNYWVIWKWLQLFNDQLYSTYGGPEIFKGIGGVYPKLSPEMLYDYTTTIVINALDEYNKPKVEFVFKNAFAIKLGNILYNFRDPDEIDCSFDFAFNQLDVHLI